LDKFILLAEALEVLPEPVLQRRELPPSVERLAVRRVLSRVLPTF